MEPGLATIQRYDHKAEREKLSFDENFEILVVAKNQYVQAMKDEAIDCAGIGCVRRRRLIHMFRCFFCGRYFCGVCSKEHFGNRFTDNKSIPSDA